MDELESDTPETKPKTADVVTTKVNVAFPFSQIKVQEPSEALIELSALVCELADLVTELAPESNAPALAQRARDLATRLQ